MLVNVWLLWLAELPSLAKEHQDQEGNSLRWTQICQFTGQHSWPSVTLSVLLVRWYLDTTNKFVRKGLLALLVEMTCWHCLGDRAELECNMGLQRQRKGQKTKITPYPIHRCRKYWTLKENERETGLFEYQEPWIYGPICFWHQLHDVIGLLSHCYKKDSETQAD